MSISVIIATYNRCNDLKDTLNSLLLQQIVASFHYQIIVVDNNSSDNTKRVVKEYISKFNGNLSYLFEPKQGKSFALNTGIDQAKFDIITTTDDDAIADSQWLHQIYKTFIDYEVDMVGGKVLLLHEGDWPSWLSDKTSTILGVLGQRDYGEDTKFVTDKSLLFCGLNMAFKKECGIRFREGLGVKKGEFFISGGEDTQIFLDFLDTGKKMIYQPRAIIYHKVTKNRLNKNYFRKWFYYYSQADFFRTLNQEKKINGLIPKFKNTVLVGLTSSILAYIKWIFLKNKHPQDYFERELGVFHYLGKLVAKFKSINRIF